MYKTYISFLIFIFIFIPNIVFATWYGQSELIKKELYPLSNYSLLYFQTDSGNFTCGVYMDKDVFHLGDKFQTVNVDNNGACVQLDKLDSDNVIYKYLGLLAGLLAGFAIVRWWTSLM